MAVVVVGCGRKGQTRIGDVRRGGVDVVKL